MFNVEWAVLFIQHSTFNTQHSPFPRGTRAILLSTTPVKLPSGARTVQSTGPNTPGGWRGGVLAEERAAAVDGEWGSRVVDFVRSLFATIKDEIAGDVDEQRFDFVGSLREELDRGAIDRIRDPLVRFRGIDARVAGAVDD